LLAVSPYEYRYKPHGGTRASSQALGVDAHAVVKTLVMEDEGRAPLIVLMHGDREASTRQLARQDDPRELVCVLGAVPVDAAQ